MKRLFVLLIFGLLLLTCSTVYAGGITAGAGTDLVFKLGDNAGANGISITDSDDVEVANIDSNGNLTVFTISTDIGIAASDETTDLTTGTSKVTFRSPYAFTLTEVRANVNTAPVGSTIEVDINESGTTVLSTVISIDASEKTSETAATPPVISDSAIADDGEITIDIDQIGSSTAGKGLKIWLIGTRIL